MEKVVNCLTLLDILLERGEHDYVIKSGALRSSKYITKDGDRYYVMNLIDSSEDCFTVAELLSSNIGRAILNNTFYCETSDDVQDSEEDEEEKEEEYEDETDDRCLYAQRWWDRSFYEDGLFL